MAETTTLETMVSEIIFSSKLKDIAREADAPEMDKTFGWDFLAETTIHEEILVLDTDFSPLSTQENSTVIDEDVIQGLAFLSDSIEDLLRTGRTIIAIVSDYQTVYETERRTWGESNYSWLPPGLHYHPHDPQAEFVEEIENPEKPTVTSKREPVRKYFNNVQFAEYSFYPKKAGIEDYEVLAEDKKGDPVALSFNSWKNDKGRTKEYDGDIILLPQPTNLRFDTLTWFESLIEIGKNDPEQEFVRSEQSNEIEEVMRICRRFPSVARQLEERYNDRETIEMSDEYDVQDLFHALLRLRFEDIRAEEYAPSHAGSSGRIDFLLKEVKTTVEIKYATDSRKNRTMKKEISEDKEHYRSHPDCETLICYIYDPDFNMTNPSGFEKDLSGSTDNLTTEVFVSSSSN